MVSDMGQGPAWRVIWSTGSELEFAQSLRRDHPELYAGYVAGLRQRKHWGEVDPDKLWAWVRAHPPLEVTPMAMLAARDRWAAVTLRGRRDNARLS